MTTTDQRTREELEAEIAALRAELGATVAALSQKIDVKARLRRRAANTSPAVPAALAVLVLTVAVVAWRRRS